MTQCSCSGCIVERADRAAEMRALRAHQRALRDALERRAPTDHATANPTPHVAHEWVKNVPPLAWSDGTLVAPRDIPWRDLQRLRAEFGPPADAPDPAPAAPAPEAPPINWPAETWQWRGDHPNDTTGSGWW
jgi:hypothetical protein